MKKQLLAVGAVTTLGLAGVAGMNAVSATDNGASENKPMSGLVDALASKFNLNKTDVQAVVDEQRTKHQQEHEAEVKEKLTQAVKDGKLTQEQADKLTAKREEMRKEMEANRNSDTKPSRSDMEAKRTELDAWAKENGIDTEYLRSVMGGGKHHGHDGPTREQAD